MLISVIHDVKKGDDAFRIANGRFLKTRSFTRHLAGVLDIEAAYLAAGEDGIVHVYSVMLEHRSEVYCQLLEQERLIENDCPGVTFEFHVRVHQGRKPFQAVPFGAHPVYFR
jgi:hypothetical protein